MAEGREQVPPERLCGCTRKNHGSVIWQCPNPAGPVTGSCEDCRHNRCPTGREQAGVVVPREVVEHLLDWHNKTPCGEGRDAYDEVIFDVLKTTLGHDEEAEDAV